MSQTFLLQYVFKLDWYDVIDESHDIKHIHQSVEFQNKYPRNLFVVFYLNH